MARVLLTVLIACGLVAGAAFYLDLVPTLPGVGNHGAAAAQPDGEKEKKFKSTFAERLYAVVEQPPIVQPKRSSDRDPIVVSGQINVSQQVDIACPVDGRVAFIGEQVPEGATAVAGIAPFLVEPFGYVPINRGMSQSFRFYRLLKENQVVYHRQMVALVDPSKALQEVEKADVKIMVAKVEARSAEFTTKEARNRLIRAEKLYNLKSLPEEDLGLAKLTVEKSDADYQVKVKTIELAEAERGLGANLLKDHEIINNIESPRSIIKRIHKKGHESVKAGDPIVQLYSLDKLEVEAMVDSQFARQMTVGMSVIIEPQQEESPKRRLASHRAEVTCIAVTKDPSPLFVSGSEDKTVLVWDPEYQGPQWTLGHPEAVRAVVCSPPAAKHNVILVGCADGSIHLWDLGRKTERDFTEKPSRKAANAHRDAVTALAFSPDGKYFATGSADNAIKIWETEGDFSKPLYVFDYDHGVTQPHQGSITALNFTPQGRLVSAARDGSLRVWTLFKDGAKPHRDPIHNRSGSVGQLGVSTDGRWMLFDHAKTLQIRSVETGQSVSVPLQNPGGGIPFETLAVVSPDASLILTAGAAEGRLQLWKAPTGSTRGFEVRQLSTVERSPVTCAAFSPYTGKSKELSFAVSGSKDGSVYLWQLPTQQEVNQHRIENVPLSRISQFVDAGSRQVRIIVDLRADTGGPRLEPGRPVTIVIEP